MKNLFISSIGRSWLKIISVFFCHIAIPSFLTLANPPIAVAQTVSSSDVEQEWWCPNQDVYTYRVCANSLDGAYNDTLNAADAYLRSTVVDYGYSSYRQYKKIGKRSGCTISQADWPRYQCSFTIVFTNIQNRDNQLMDEYEQDWGFYVNMICGAPLKNVYLRSKNSCFTKQSFEPPFCVPCTIGNPIGPLDGLKYESLEFFRWGRGHRFEATYNYLRESFSDPMVEGMIQSFGKVWFSNLHKLRYGASNLSQEIGSSFFRGNGRHATFAGAVSPLERDRAVPTGVLSSYYYYYDNNDFSVENYQIIKPSDSNVPLTTIGYIDGRSLKYNYASVDIGGLTTQVLDSISDDSGRIVRFHYERVLEKKHLIRLNAVEDPDGNKYTFRYSGQGMLYRIAFPDETLIKYEYGAIGKPWLITAKIDENGDVFGRYDYDSMGRAVRTKTGSAGAEWSVEWLEAPTWGGNDYVETGYATVITKYESPDRAVALIHGPDGYEEKMTGTQLSGTALVSQREFPAGSGSSASATKFEYDAAGNVVRRIDGRGLQICSTFGAAHRETVRVEGVPSNIGCASVLGSNSDVPTESRKTTTQWHPAWSKQVRTAEPKLITTLVYNGQPDPTNGNAVASCAPATAKLPDGSAIVVLCKRVEQATTDVDGSKGFNAIAQPGVPARVWTWTYDATGHVLTETDPLGRTTTNEYYSDITADHWIGDLRSSTNAAGHVTNYLRYNALGKLLEMVDANGISTSYTYDVRSRLTSVTQAGQTTSYAYWPTGLLKQVTQPDGSSVSYDYDDAHRLVAVADNLGNRIQYTLDQRGNRTNETVQDPSGALQRNMSRVFDALSRTQQTTGGE